MFGLGKRTTGLKREAEVDKLIEKDWPEVDEQLQVEQQDEPFVNMELDKRGRWRLGGGRRKFGWTG